MPQIITEYPQFFTATNLEWKVALEKDEYKDVIIRSLRFLVEDERVIVYAFVIMPNHIHIVWQMQAGMKRENVQRDFLKFTAQRIKDRLKVNAPDLLLQFLVNAKDRKYQLWERNPLSVGLWTEQVMMEKIRYIHENPVRAGLCSYSHQYKYSSALFYHAGNDNWGFLTHVRD
jgi:REP element-mobilizing transposase RayT